MLAPPGGSICALLGPTNTGKTHRAVERMLEHQSGMIGLPLRLLAREVYDKVTALVGENATALVTGEEKRIPRAPRYWVCTVESMPVDRDVDFLAIDEVQLAAHPQRGHVFTDRMLHARGRLETWLLGADTMRPLVTQLVPTAEIRRHPRLSRLSSAGKHGLSALPPRSAVIAFSAAEVYQLADRLRRRRGGAAVVLGALSPRTRNAQVAMYQAGEVDFLVATDAIGMGLNMDVDHVAFSAVRKFDGFRPRSLTPAEMAQIAGRAGRHTRDGTFGTVAPLELATDVTFAVENHRFAAVRTALWRNSDLDTTSVDTLLRSLTVRPPVAGLQLTHRAADHAVLLLLAQREEIVARTQRPEGVALLWDVCRIPDFEKLLAEHHAGLVAELFLQLRDKGRVDAQFMDERIRRLEDPRGDIDDLMMRMDFIRTWSYVAHHPHWVEDAAGWQERTRAAEDRLSEALHERLIQRFVERTARGRTRSRPSSSGRRGDTPHRREPTWEDAAPSSPFGALASLRARPQVATVSADAWVEAVVDAPHADFRIDATGFMLHLGNEESPELERIGRLTRGVDIVHPECKVDATRSLGAGAQSRILRRLRALGRDFVDEALGPLRDPRMGELSPAGRGLVYQLERGLGTIVASTARAQVSELTEEDRVLLDALEVCEGRRFIYARPLLDASAIGRRAALGAAWFGPQSNLPAGAPSAPLPPFGEERLLTLGYAAFGERAVRVDAIEDLEDALSDRVGTFTLPEETAEQLGVTDDDVERIVLSLGFHRVAEGFVRPARRRRQARSSKR